MPAPPVDDHTEEYEQLAALSALRVLEGDDLDRFAEHASTCERCRLMLRVDRETVARVSLAAPEMDPSPDFKSRLMRRAAEELRQSPRVAGLSATAEAAPAAPSEAIAASGAGEGDDPADAEPLPLRARAAAPVLQPLWRRWPYLSALAAVLVVGIIAAGAFGYENQTVASYPLSGNAPGTAVLTVRRSGSSELEMHGVPDPGPGFVYEAWIIPPGKQPVAAGSTASGEAKVPLSGDVRGSTIAITREPGRVDAPTGTPLMSTVVQS